MRQVLGPGALGRARGIGSRGRWEGGSFEDKDYLDPTDEYAYQEGDEIVESYQAVNSSELESMQ